jgi:dehydrogenase/reductase SDR family protein 12
MGAKKNKGKFWSTLALLADKTILFSFDRTGFFLHQQGFDPSDLDHSMQGKVCVITGGNSGIGRATARALAMRGAEVWILCRNRERGLVAVDELREETKNHHIQLAVVDVSDLDSVQKFAATFTPKQVDVLIHNAGAMPAQKTLTPQGLELTFATFVAGPFLLTHLLLPKLENSPDARVVFVSSGGMYTQKLDLGRLQGEKEPYNDLVAYAQGKRAQVILNEMLASKYRKTKIKFYAMHPGWANTRAVRSAMPSFFRLMRPLLRTAEQGADTLVWLAVNPKAKEYSGEFWFDRQVRPTHVLKSTHEDKASREALWGLCQTLVRPAP